MAAGAAVVIGVVLVAGAVIAVVATAFSLVSGGGNDGGSEPSDYVLYSGGDYSDMDGDGRTSDDVDADGDGLYETP